MFLFFVERLEFLPLVDVGEDLSVFKNLERPHSRVAAVFEDEKVRFFEHFELGEARVVARRFGGLTALPLAVFDLRLTQGRGPLGGVSSLLARARVDLVLLEGELVGLAKEGSLRLGKRGACWT